MALRGVAHTALYHLAMTAHELLNELHTHTHTHTRVCVCVCVCCAIKRIIFMSCLQKIACYIFKSVCLYHLYTGDVVSLFEFNKYVATKIPSKWKRVGVSLGLRQSQIDAIEYHHRKELLECFSDVFKYWQNESTPERPANWATLISVLQSNTVGEEALAEHIQSTLMEDTHQ